ncbi:1-(5-phosphoribosyl)-5-[(5-phosphoribosylamino)methylideneamino]imidazole-4-carboxamide isomerase [Idiomarina ramblicola]|uniref:1-(5-phosphoribosyl)-5-[(5-phosphoribosylamino)methylideneamino] imidazole-4-carboxamide isomerase n=1 Tax=Idiomarina ramblicola TaxID=263724 RepID=A0A432Z6B9_9GAMM|nr:1-(5-phosphoribosyl)-5-[(5-phosphoribosylamino)methylideneamino]imidazole-4-carboxamide isomerase [Idiomarina ramblicola]RUO73468.1 1-(5-phosphoribosyl)-5-[(5-phosphoribosylamino)methylideneamino]imidazole-4-carboxamide isomerase [Idiomarina ramblicola]
MLIPALDLIDGKVVRLYQGDFAQKTEFDLTPLGQAQLYAEAGAEWLHLVDLDGAKDPEKRQQQLLAKLASASGMKCQAGGGIRTTADLETLFEAGIERAVIGSTAVNQPEKVTRWFEMYGAEKIVLALDVNINQDGNAMVATHGWQQASTHTLDDILNRYLDLGCRHVLCTDISKDGTMKGTNVELYQRYKQLYPQVVWQASGGVSCLDDLTDLKAVNCDSVILGKSLLTGAFTMQEALECWQNA